MSKLLATVGVWIISSVIAKLLIALGIGLFTYHGLYYLIEQLLEQLRGTWLSFPEVAIQILTLAGVPEGLSIICSAVLTRAAINSVKVFIGAMP